MPTKVSMNTPTTIHIIGHVSAVTTVYAVMPDQASVRGGVADDPPHPPGQHGQHIIQQARLLVLTGAHLSASPPAQHAGGRCPE